MLRRVLAIVGTLVLVAGGLVGLDVADRLSGGGLQPAALLPSDVSAAMVLDLNPALDQKLAVRTLAAHIPSIRGSSDTDLRVRFVRLVLPGCANAAHDIRPWLGSRVALALPAADGSIAPVAVVAIRGGRADQARDGLSRVVSCSHGAVYFGIRDGYALITRNAQALTRLMTVSRAQSLAHDPTYSRDLRRLHGHQLATIWGDGSRVDGLLDHVADWLPMGHTIRPLLPHLSGRAVVGVHATGAYLEMQITTIAVVATGTGTQRSGPADIATAPPDAIAAAYTSHSLNPLVDTLVQKVLPKPLTHLGLIAQLLHLPAVHEGAGVDGGRVLTLTPAAPENPNLRAMALASIPGSPALVLYLRPDALPGIPAFMHRIRAIGVVVSTNGTARVRVVL